MLSNVETRLNRPPFGSAASRAEQRHRHAVDRRQAIVVGLDFSGPSHRALGRAIDVARTHDARLHLLHATPRVTTAVDELVGSSRSVEVARDELERITAKVGSTGLAARAHVVIGGVTRALKSTAAEQRAALVVVGVRRRALPDALLGTKAERVAAATARPVLVVRRPARRPYRHVVLAIDASSNLEELLAASRLVAPSAKRSILHAYEDPLEGGALLDVKGLASLRISRTQARWVARARLTPIATRAGVNPNDITLRHGSARRVLELEDHEQRDNDALFVLERERSRVGQILFGSVSSWLLEHGECDVLLV